ncbi:hypothetical protein SETIT_1G143200v2 [Setaria italica]|uniref:Uncharacterized protein n=2 Tax=Setaria TaxID=4554 RepID=K3YX91_SETIT|nr:hypothetical protein SETIT_1G143200v2 [Setaria italica]TKW38845.1 hypothetical protein SEVIR_1G142000v2 [Setaria viridis]
MRLSGGRRQHLRETAFHGVWLQPLLIMDTLFMLRSNWVCQLHADIDKFRKDLAAELIFAEANKAHDVKAAGEALMNQEDDDDAE